MDDALIARSKSRLAVAITSLGEAIRLGRVYGIQCRYQRSADEKNAWYGQIVILEPVMLDHDLLVLQSEINVLCQRLAGHPSVGLISVKATDRSSGPSITVQLEVAR